MMDFDYYEEYLAKSVTKSKKEKLIQTLIFLQAAKLLMRF